MTSEEALYLLMTNQKKVRDDFKFIDLNTHEKVSIEECYDIVMKNLERLEKLEKVLEIIKNKCAANTNIWLVVCTRTYEDYESFVENKDHKLVRLEHNILTQQEYDLLREVLEDE